MRVCRKVWAESRAQRVREGRGRADAPVPVERVEHRACFGKPSAAGARRARAGAPGGCAGAVGENRASGGGLDGRAGREKALLVETFLF